MAGQFTDYWRIVKPAPAKAEYNASPEETKFFNNFSWYTKVMKGASSRNSKYTQYKGMDGDVFVSRALDTIAEEMSNRNIKTNLPFDINYQNEVNRQVDHSVTELVRAALRHWCEIQDLNQIIFDICRVVIKYGDCFFRKTSDFKKWQYLNPEDIVGIVLDKDTNRPTHYHLRTGAKNDKGAFGDYEIVPIAGMVHFTLSSGLGEAGPFGESILYPVIKAYRHLSLLEDSAIIYRIVRAPERRVFFIDTGNMPPQRVKSYLESIKNEVRQKRVPNERGGQEQIDSVYNPMSMTEDFFFAQGANGRGSRVETLPGGECLALDTKLKLLDGRVETLQTLIDEHAAGKENWVYSANPLTGEFKPGLITWAGITRKDAKVMRLTFDDGHSVVVTPDHKFPVRDNDVVELEAQDLKIGQSMLSLYARKKQLAHDSEDYEQLFNHVTSKWEYTHRLVAKSVKGTLFENQFKHETSHQEKLTTIHHLDFNRFNNSPTNLAWMGKQDHWKYHSDTIKARGGWKQATDAIKHLKQNNPEAYKKIIDAQVDGRRRWKNSLTAEQIAAYNESVSKGIKRYFQTIDDYQKAKHSKASRDNFRKGNEKLIERLATDPIFKVEFGKKISDGQQRKAKEDPESWMARSEKIGKSHSALWEDVEFRAAHSELNKKNFQAYMERDPAGFAERNRKTSEAKKFIYTDWMVERVKATVRDTNKPYLQRSELVELLQKDEEFVKTFIELNIAKQAAANSKKALTTFESGHLVSLLNSSGYHNDWKGFRKDALNYKNHKLVKIEWLDDRQDTGTITVDGIGFLHHYHNFALENGVIVTNSLGEISDISYFQNKLLQGLRIPSSYMRGSADQGGQVQDGKVGVAYIEELRFANYVSRLQRKINKTFDSHFKAYLKSAGLTIDPQLFYLELPAPQDFDIYRQAEVDEKLLSIYGNVKDMESISQRYGLIRYLHYTEDDLNMNESLLKEERHIPDDGIAPGLSAVRMMYDKKWQEGRPDIKVSDDYDNYTKETEAPKAPESASEDTESEEDQGEETQAEASGSEEPQGEETSSEHDDNESNDTESEETKAEPSGEEKK